jgi:hypothetical protein
MTSQVLDNFQSVYVTVYRHKQLFYIEAMKCASTYRKSLSSDIDTCVTNFQPIRERVTSKIFYNNVYNIIIIYHYSFITLFMYMYTIVQLLVSFLSYIVSLFCLYTVNTIILLQSSW